MLTEKERKILSYCIPHVEQMWAAQIVSIVVGGDFRDVKSKCDFLTKIVASEETPKDEIWFIKDDGTVDKIVNVGKQ